MPISPYDGYTAGSNWIRANQPVVVTNAAALRALDKTKIGYAVTKGYYSAGDGGAGEYWYDSSDTTSTDNGGSVIVGSDSGRWKLIEKGVANVKKWGAKGNGSFDDTQFLYNCMYNNGTVFFPPGVYIISSEVYLPGSGVQIIGAGIERTTIEFTGTQGISVGAKNNSSRYNSFVLRDVTISGNNRANTVSAFKLYSLSWFHVSNVLFYQIAGAAIYSENCWDGTVKTCHFQYCGNTTTSLSPLHMEKASGGENNHWNISDCQFEDNYTTDIFNRGLSNEADHFISRNKFGIASYSPTADLDTQYYHIVLIDTVGTSVEDNWFFTGGCLYAENSVGFKMQNNSGRYLSSGVYIQTGSGYNISGNRFEGNNLSTQYIGSMSASHYGIAVGGARGTLQNNDCFKFYTDHTILPAGSYNIITFPQANGSFVQTGSSGAVVLDSGANTSMALGQESGSWSPTASFATGTISSVSFQSATYIRQNNKVFASVYIQLTDSGTGAGELAISGLPYPSKTGSPVGVLGSEQYSNHKMISGFLPGGSSSVYRILYFDGTSVASSGTRHDFLVTFEYLI